jgi:transposase
MPTRAQVVELLEAGHSYESAATLLGVPAGQVYMIATGAPADGSDGRPRQDLVNPPAHNPTRDERVLEWVRERASRELR